MKLYELYQIDEDWKSTLKGAALAGAALAANHQYHSTKVEPPKQVQTVKKANPSEKVLALTMWGEARNQGKNGMRAVGHVIKNRAESGLETFADTIEGVAKQPSQFSAWNRNDSNYKLMNNIDQLDKSGQDYKMWQEAQVLAKRILSGNDSDLTKGALFYHTDSIKPRWARNADPIAKIGDHVFYASL